HDVARRAYPLLQKFIIGDKRVGRLKGRRWGNGIFAVIDVHVTVASIGWRLKLGCFRSCRIRHLLRTYTPQANAGASRRHCQHASCLEKLATTGVVRLLESPPLFWLSDNTTELDGSPPVLRAPRLRRRPALLESPTWRAGRAQQKNFGLSEIRLEKI